MDINLANVQQTSIDTPVCSASQSLTTTSNTVIKGVVTATDPMGRAITYTLSVSPLFGAVTLNYATGAWSYEPNLNFVGNDFFTILATNTTGQYCSTNVNIMVAAQAPNCPLPQTVQVLMNNAGQGSITAMDPQGEAITYQIASYPGNGTAVINPDTGDWTYTPFAGYSGGDTFTVKAQNKSELSCIAIVNLNVLRPSVVMEKKASPNQVAVGSTFLYSLQATNNGTANIIKSVITDVLPSQFEVVDLALNGTPITGNLQSGVNIGELPVGMTSVLIATIKVKSQLNPGTFYNIATGSFDAEINPDQAPVSLVVQAQESVGVTVFTPSLILIKSAGETTTAVGEMISYSISARNEGNIPLEQILIRDLLAPEVEFKDSSLTVNGITIPNANIISGINIGTLTPSQMATISFKAEVINEGNGIISNISNAAYHYQTSTKTPPSAASTNSNEVIIKVRNPHLLLTKKADKELAVLGDTITYDITITNDGDVDAVNVVFQDSIPNSICLINGTFRINGNVINNIDLSKGVNIGSLPMMDTAHITYQADIVSTDCTGIIKNLASVNYGYLNGNDLSISQAKAEYVCTETALAITLFKQISIKNDLVVSNSNPDMEQINDVKGYAEITDSYLVKTPTGLSLEGQNLTGNKMIIHGVLKLIIDYTADLPEQNVHSAVYYIPFSTFIVMPPEHDTYCSTFTNVVVEDIYFTQYSNRSFFTNTTLLVTLNTK